MWHLYSAISSLVLLQYLYTRIRPVSIQHIPQLPRAHTAHAAIIGTMYYSDTQPSCPVRFSFLAWWTSCHMAALQVQRLEPTTLHIWVLCSYCAITTQLSIKSNDCHPWYHYKYSQLQISHLTTIISVLLIVYDKWQI